MFSNICTIDSQFSNYGSKEFKIDDIVKCFEVVDNPVSKKDIIIDII